MPEAKRELRAWANATPTLHALFSGAMGAVHMGGAASTDRINWSTAEMPISGKTDYWDVVGVPDGCADLENPEWTVVLAVHVGGTAAEHRGDSIDLFDVPEGAPAALISPDGWQRTG